MASLEQAKSCSAKSGTKKAHVMDLKRGSIACSLSEEVGSVEGGARDFKMSMHGMLIGPRDQSSPNILYIVVERYITLVKDMLVLRGQGPVIRDGIGQLGRVRLLRVNARTELSAEVPEESLCMFVVAEMNVIVVSGDKIGEGQGSLDACLPTVAGVRKS